MSAAIKLTEAINKIDWNNNCQLFLKNDDTINEIANTNLRMAVWSKQLENVEHTNPAICFVREMQAAGHSVAALLALGLYKAAASSMRSILESALYYTYFRTHLSELTTLANNKDYYISKNEVLEYHKTHTKNYASLQHKLGLHQAINDWYSDVSAIIHGQVPGLWPFGQTFSDFGYHETGLKIATTTFRLGEEITHELFLTTVGQELWDLFSKDGKQALLKGLSGEKKALLKLDVA
ncbi:hypothetical protein A7981_04380 [Methylovorus sp. MM2]|uniref:hypothetical protein n=1 Tax=Methylovorus sp. MM2 TaxID=1848038 RepID=UPI0007E07BF8|nr:hypothetical protein [Methylovorus sp. MM2]OAM52695.1 hypothetical protein A7981_04380 [Methylovorus sp. MM2]